ncbi:MAG: S-layer homology domain-containing protein, partial [Clostridiales bacterium]|nr:S-layer homology domain-containing protein [Clostridiales bacterium]
AFTVLAYGDDDPEGKFIDAEAAGGELVPIDGFNGCYIMASTAGDCVYIVDKDGSRLVDILFICVYNKTDFKSYLRVRYAYSNDFSGFAVLDSDFKAVISPNDYQKISCVFSNCLTGDKCDKNGSLIYECYEFITDKNEYVFNGLKDTSADSVYGVSNLAEERVAAAEETGLIPDTLKDIHFQWGAARYDWACLALQAVLLKADTDLYSYIVDNEITLDYDKYIDVVSPNVLLAEELGLIAPTEGRYFNPDKEITRQEAAYTLNRLCELFGVKTTPKKTAFDDDGNIADWAKESVYNVSGTRIDGTFVLPRIGENSFMPTDISYCYYLERGVMAVWRLYNSGNIDFSGYTSKFNITDIGCGLYAYQSTEGGWGVYGDNFAVEAFYELPCPIDNYSAFGGNFTLTSKYVYNSNGLLKGNDFVVFNDSGEIIKKLTYGMSDVKTEKPKGLEFHHISLVYVSGSNLVFRGYVDNDLTEHYDFIKRLVSEKIAGEDYDSIKPYGDTGFTAVEVSTGKSCILNPDGSFKEYTEE